MAKRAAREGEGVGVDPDEAGIRIRREEGSGVGWRMKRTWASRGWIGGVPATTRRKGRGRGAPAVIETGGGTKGEGVGEDMNRGEEEEMEERGQ